MKPKTPIQKEVIRLSATLPELTNAQRTYAFHHCFKHYGRRTAKGVITCTECGHAWKSGHSLADTLCGCTCPNCGTHNQPGAAQCSHCGCPLPKDDGPRPDPKDEDAQVPIYARDPSTVHKPDNSRTTPGPRIDTYTDDDNGGICRREIGPEDTIDGIKAKDWAAYVGRSPMYYLMQFFRMSITKQKVAVCLSAFLFGPAYLLYRKMWKEGLLTALLSIVLSVPSLIAIVATFNPSLFGSMPLHWVPVAADVCAIADWIVRILLGLFSVWLYRNTSKKNIDKIYSEYPEGDARTDALLQKGGTSFLSVILYYAVILLLASLVINLAGPDFVQYAMAMSGY